VSYSLSNIIIFYAYLLAISLIGIKVSDKSKNIILMIQVLSVSLFFGLRDASVGADTKIYISVYLNQQTWIDIGLVLINKIIFLFVKSNWKVYLFIICLISSLNMALTYKIIFRNSSKYINLAYWTLFCMPYTILMDINIIRQGLALSFFMLGISLLHISNRKIGIILIMLSCSIHYSMIIVALGFFLFLFLRINFAVSILLIIFSLLVSMSGITESIIKLLPDGYIRGRFLSFLSLEAGMGLLMKYLFYMGNYIIMLLISSRIKDRIYSYFSKLMSFFLVSSAFLYISDFTATRFLLSADYLIPLIYVYPLTKIKEKRIYLTIYLLFMVTYFIFIISSQSIRINLNI
jgi:hypothetical protein